jgi:hypothetical protein
MSRLFCACADAPTIHRLQTSTIRVSRFIQLLLLRALEAHDEATARPHLDGEVAGAAGRDVDDVGDRPRRIPCPRRRP